MKLTKVFHVDSRQEISFSLPPEEAVIAAHAQSKKDYQTWNYKEKYKAIRAKYGWVCGEFWAAA